MELEIRAKIANLDKLQEKLNKLEGIKKKSSSQREVDTYLKHGKDDDRLLIFRIRRKKKKALLTLKTKSFSGDDILWRDIDIPFNEPDRLEDILMNSGYVYVTLIDKIRDSFQYKDFEINIDNVRELGQFIEIEYLLSDETEKNGKLKEMKQILRDLGISNKDVIQKGYVPLMIEKLGAGE